ncbi:MAG: hypothetical protein ACYTF7_06195 [Planctomycetota bacterium]|jgi:hypothetical protein
MVHITHEAAHHVGGIGTVLRGLITSDAYQSQVARTLMIGPLWSEVSDEGATVLDHPGARVLHATRTGTRDGRFSEQLERLENDLDVGFVIGRRPYTDVESSCAGSQKRVEVDVALIDVRRMRVDRVNETKAILYNHFGLTSDRYEQDPDYEQWVRLAYPALELCEVLLDGEDDRVLVSHEYMGVPSALLATLDTRSRYTTILHGHECASARPLVEHHAGHDAAFYGAMERGVARGESLDDVFGDQSHMPRHALVSRAFHLDATLAVGRQTASEFAFLSDRMRRSRIEVCPNGVPAGDVAEKDVLDARGRVDDWLERGIGFRPDVLITHVTRPVVSKGLWRDLMVCRCLAPMLRARDQRGVYLLVTTASDERSPEDVERMAGEHDWPFSHRDGWPDLVGCEAQLLEQMHKEWNNGDETIRPLLVNQWGDSPSSFGPDGGFTMCDLRLATDVELGLSVYEPFGIAPLEPLHAGAICAITSISGCAGFVSDVMKSLGESVSTAPSIVIADCTVHEHPDPIRMTQNELRDIEEIEMRHVAESIDRCLRQTTRSERIEFGQRVASQLSWEHVASEWFLPSVQAARSAHAQHSTSGTTKR